MESHGRKRGLVVFVMALAVCAYLLGYIGVRRHHLSLEYVASRLLFESAEDARKWQAEFLQLQDTTELMYYHDTLLYVLFWPAIQIDSAISGRVINSPFAALSYAVPQTNESSQQPPAGDVLNTAPKK